MNRAIKYITKDRLPIAFMVLYFSGLVLYFLPLTRDLFILATPYTLILVTIAVFLHHEEWNPKTVIVFACVFVMSIVAEIIGVATGNLFGDYNYGEGLGLKIADVPIIIGLNWLVLVYASNGIISKITSNSLLIIVGASLLMVAYDIVLEKVAPLMDMWMFSENKPPLDNYVMWFILAILFHVMFQIFKIKTNNASARWLFFTQLIFFVIIVISHYLIF